MFSKSLYQVSHTCTCSIYTNPIAWLPNMNNGCVKRLFLLSHDHWAWLHKYWTKKKMMISWKKASLFKMNKSTVTGTGSML